MVLTKDVLVIGMSSTSGSESVFPQHLMLPAEEVCVEAHLSTQQPAACQEARLSRPDEHQGRPRRAEVASGQGPPPSVRLIGSVRGRSEFERLSRTGSRVRVGSLWCTFVLDPLVSPPRVAYAIGRAVGPAVTRNRLRRRLRSLLHQNHPDLPAGLYLIGAIPGAAARSFSDLEAELRRLVARVG
ncbi:MAG: ribonuclease protein component [Ilumatobacteraceae bacterium]|nr:ribonuclease protein component [Ilumatobacteraceae bacterium]MCU1390771.1 ribonuclease protein component [Ilumatobacteraceae bacterium]